MRLCDRCGREINEDIYYTVTASIVAERLTKTDRDFDYCEECGKNILEILSEAHCPADPEPKKPAETKNKGGRTKIKLDLGKVGALRKANWTIAQIADEMKVGTSTIQRALAQIAEQEEEETDG
jgi:hypothetical protein